MAKSVQIYHAAFRYTDDLRRGNRMAKGMKMMKAETRLTRKAASDRGG